LFLKSASIFERSGSRRQTWDCASILHYCHKLTASADFYSSCGISSWGMMVESVIFSVSWAWRPQQAHSNLWWRRLPGSYILTFNPSNLFCVRSA
jgi:hypothetical protein